MPPLPWCSVQVTEVGSDEIAPAMATIATGAKANLPRQASSGWPLLSRSAQNRGGSSTEHAGQAKQLHQQVGENGAEGPEQIADAAAGHVREAGIGGRPGGEREAAGQADDEHAGTAARSSQRPKRWR